MNFHQDEAEKLEASGSYFTAADALGAALETALLGYMLVEWAEDNGGRIADSGRHRSCLHPVGADGHVPDGSLGRPHASGYGWASRLILIEFQVFSPTGKRVPELRCVLGADGHPTFPYRRMYFCYSLRPASADARACLGYSFLTLSH
jgi:hypothetical protein